MFADALYYLKHRDNKQESERGHADCLRVIRSTPIKVILSGATADELSIACEVNREPAESALNDILIQWKNKGLPEHLQKSSSAQLRDLVTDLEKGILKLDLKAKKLKDLADEDARKVQAPGQTAPAKMAPAGALATAHLLDQRKTILMVILGSVKQAAAQRASGG